MPGIIDWLAHGYPTEGRHADRPTAGRVARLDVATCGLDDTVATARARAASSGGLCVVVNEERVVLGLLRAAELEAADDRPASEVMRAGPSTFRPHVPIAEMAEWMAKHEADIVPVTAADGRLIGLLFRDDAVSAARGGS